MPKAPKWHFWVRKENRRDATLVAIVCAVGYLIAGFMKTPVVALVVETILLAGSVLVLSKRKNVKEGSFKEAGL